MQEVIKGFHSIVKTATKDYNEMNGGSSKREVWSLVIKRSLKAAQSSLR